MGKADPMPIGPSVVGLIQKELEAESIALDRFGAVDSRSLALAKRRAAPCWAT